MKKEIFKFQTPVFTTDPSLPVLIYNKDRSIETTLALPKKQRKIIFHGEYKTYWLCKPNTKTQKLDLIEEVEEQEW